MNFVDNNGHTFCLPSFDEKLIGYEFEENRYVFWVNLKNADNLSIDNYYVKIINFLIPDIAEITDIGIDIEMQSNIFSLLSSIQINDLISEQENFKSIINIDEDDRKQKLTDNDLTFIKISENGKNYIMIPLYIICNAKEEGTWISNIMIHVFDKSGEYSKKFKDDWCPISVGGTFVDDSEELIINGKNFGINIPKDILKAVYQQSFYDNSFNHKIYNNKVKEYLLNYMDIKGQLGNFNSAINSLSWFGWGKNLTISKLLQTDNQFKNQFIRDYFDISYDVLKSFRTFRNSTYISISLKLNNETSKLYEFDFDKEFYGENKPELESLIDKSIFVKDDENESLSYIKSYYDYSFNELGLKLACLKYFYTKYFLPIHLSINSISTEHKVYTNDIKLINIVNTNICEKPIMMEHIYNDVEFPIDNVRYLTKQIHYVDSIFNEYKSINDYSELYYINDTCANIPIKFKNNDKYYNCVLLLEKEKENYNKEYIVSINCKISLKYNLVIYDKNNKVRNLDDIFFCYSFDDKKYSAKIKGYNNLLDYIISKTSNEYPVYRVNNDYFVEINGEEFKIEDEPMMYDFDGYTIYVNSKNDLQENVLYNDYFIYASIVPDFIIKFDYDDAELKRIILSNIEKINIEYLVTENDEFFSSEDNILFVLEETVDDEHKLNKDAFKEIQKIDINFKNSSDLIYEKHFQFIQNKDDQSSIYSNFVIYPKMLNKNKNINYWVNSNFILRLLVNNKWYSYKFKLKIPEPDIMFGRLQYKYWINDTNIATNFNQIKSIENNDGKRSIVFNTYMHNPELVNINHINFFDDYIKYSLNNNLKYIDGQYIDDDTFYYFIKIEDTVLRIKSDMFKKTIKLSRELLSFKNSKFLIDNINTVVNGSKKSYMVNGLKKIRLNANNIYIIDNMHSLINTSTENNDYYIDSIENAIKPIELIYDDIKNTYYCIEDGERYDYPVYEMFRKTIYNMLDKYTENINISSNGKYMNSVHLFNIYKDYYDGNNILYFHNDIYLLSNGLLFTYDNYYKRPNMLLQSTYRFNDEAHHIMNDNTKHSLIIKDKKIEDDIILYETKSNRIYISGTPYKEYIDTKDDIEPFSIYYNDKIKQYGYGYFRVVGPSGKPTYKYTTKPYSTYYGEIEYLGKAYFKNINDFKSNKYIEKDFDKEVIIEEFKLDDVIFSMYIINNEYNDYYKLPVRFEVNYKKLNKITKKYEDIKFTNDMYSKFMNMMQDNESDDYILEVKYNIQNLVHVQNELNIVSEYYRKDIDGRLYDEDGKELFMINYPHYYDEVNNKIIPYTSPGMHWFNVDDLKWYEDDIYDSNMEYYLDVKDESDVEKLNAELDKQFIKDKELYKFRNYLAKELDIKTILHNEESKKFKFVYTSSDENIKSYIIIKRDNGEEEKYIDSNSDFILKTTDKSAILYICINNTADVDYKGAWIEPYIYEYEKQKMKYVLPENETSKSIEINHKNLIYGYNDSDEVIDMYEDFFEKHKYNINGKEFDVWDSKISLDMFLDYDFYLMHDESYWFGLFISKQTINHARNIDDLQIKEKNKYFSLKSTKDESVQYDLKYVKSSNNFLLNRMEYCPSNGYNHFKSDDIIVCKLENNDRLPINIYNGSKWIIEPMSVGINKNIVNESNNEMTIFSLPKDDVKYAKGYYDVTVRYSIDSVTNNQFKNKIKIRID